MTSEVKIKIVEADGKVNCGLYLDDLLLCRYPGEDGAKAFTVKVGEESFSASISESSQKTEGGVETVKVAGEIQHTGGRWRIVDIVKRRKDSPLVQVTRRWSYEGEPAKEVKLSFELLLPHMYPRLDYYTYAGKVWNGNRVGGTLNVLGDSLREDRFSVPGCLTWECDGKVAGIFVEQRRCAEEPAVGAGIVEGDGGYLFRITVPYTDRLKRSGGYLRKYFRKNFREAFEDKRMDVEGGYELEKRFYVYLGEVEDLPGEVSGEKHGYARVLNAAWDALYQVSATIPWYSMQELYDLKMDAIITSSLLRVLRYKDRRYQIWELAKSPPEYHRAMGFAWSNYLGKVSYHALQYYKKTGYERAKKYALDSIDFFVENGVSESGLMYPAYHRDWHRAIGGPFGTYYLVGWVDMYPLGEGLYWILKAYELLKEMGIEKEGWRETAVSSCRALMRLYPDGDIPGYVKGVDGSPTIEKPSEGGPTTATYIIWTLCELYRQEGDESFLEYAEKVGEVFLNQALREEAWWKSECDNFQLDKRAGHGALKAFNDLYELTGREKWLGAAVRAGDWLASWQLHFNVTFENPRSPMAHFDYKTIGGTRTVAGSTGFQWAFAQGSHDWARLWKWTGCKRFLERARCTLHQGTQLMFTPEVIDWMNRNYLKVKIGGEFMHMHPEDFCTHHTPAHGDLQIMDHSFYAVFGLCMCLDNSFVLEEFGSVCISSKWKNGEALDSVMMHQLCFEEDRVVLRLTNMLSKGATYVIKDLDAPTKTRVQTEDRVTMADLREGAAIEFGPQETKTVILEKMP